MPTVSSAAADAELVAPIDKTPHNVLLADRMHELEQELNDMVKHANYAGAAAVQKEISRLGVSRDLLRKLTVGIEEKVKELDYAGAAELQRQVEKVIGSLRSEGDSSVASTLSMGHTQELDRQVESMFRAKDYVGIKEQRKGRLDRDQSGAAVDPHVSWARESAFVQRTLWRNQAI